MIPRIGATSLAILYELRGEKAPDVEMRCGKAQCFLSILSPANIRPTALDSVEVLRQVGSRDTTTS
jgi:hypothetical protein